MNEQQFTLMLKLTFVRATKIKIDRLNEMLAASESMFEDISDWLFQATEGTTLARFSDGGTVGVEYVGVEADKPNTPATDTGPLNSIPGLADRLAKQNAEFDAVSNLSEQYRRVTMTPIVDDDYPEVRSSYEGSVYRVIRAFQDNGRITPLPATVHPDTVLLNSIPHLRDILRDIAEKRKTK